MRLVLTYIFLVVGLIFAAVSDGHIPPPFGDRRNMDSISHHGGLLRPRESTTKKPESVQLKKAQPRSRRSGDFGAPIDRIG
ncbi:hypothetical protein KIN20_033479 [Parelaphostrongylus tenuis]|uniref:Secreted protein n=1 Tax=Parelaphostrongylus tenuis TaxID=148309 RepID=A0AAD5R8H4_PARTN|nr:hypothetical protein KIN20_033479 [Parelaphostrongylus tenuis]